MKTFAYKVPDGKLIKLKLESDDHLISKIVIMGDFFLHPEECIVDIETRLVGCEIKHEQIVEAIEDVLKERNAQLIGASPKDFADAIVMARNS